MNQFLAALDKWMSFISKPYGRRNKANFWGALSPSINRFYQGQPWISESEEDCE